METSQTEIADTSWLQSKRGRQEVCVVSVIAIGFLTVPLCVKELFPFSAATMFAFPCNKMASYKILDPEGKELDGTVFGVSYGPNIFDPPVDTFGRFGYGRKAPESAVKPGNSEAIASKEEVERIVKQRLSYFPRIKSVVVTQTIYGDKGNAVGVLEQRTWKVENPG